MINIDIETLYRRIGKYVLLISAVMEDKSWEKIIKSCRLKPHSIYSKYFDYKTKLEKHWIDEHGNSLYFENKEYKIICNDIFLLKDRILSSDLFYGRKLKEIYNTADKLIYINGNILGENIDILTFLGKDDYLRSYYIYEGYAYKVSPLMLGVETLKQIFGSDNSKLDCLLLSNIDKGFMIDLPTKTDLNKILGENLMEIINR